MKVSACISVFLAALLMGSAAFADSAACDRGCLNGIAEQYLRAMVAHDPGKAPFALQFKFTETGARLTLPDGLWRTATALGPYRLFIDEPARGGVAFFATALENGAPVILAARLKIENRLITEAETEVTRLPLPQDGSRTGLDALPETLRGTPRHQFTDPVPPNKRLSREQLIDAADRYWQDVESNDGSMPDPFTSDCQRLENGRPTTNVPAKPGTPLVGANYSCGEAFGLGFYREDNRVRDRRYLVVDEEHNVVFQNVFIDHDATVRTWQLKNGRTITSGHTGPWTWMAFVAIQITPAGKLSQIEATPNPVPYGMRGGWSNGELRPTKALWNRELSPE